jgi:carboxyl-terminal processing protease
LACVTKGHPSSGAWVLERRVAAVPHEETKMNRNWCLPRPIIWCLLLSFAASLLMAGCTVSGNSGVLQPRVKSGQLPRGSAADFGLMAEAWEKIQKNYVDKSAVKPREMTYGAIGGMVDSLGDTGHSTFLSPEMVKQEHNFETGKFKGIGAEVQMKDGRVVIVAPLDGSPAQKAGLRPGEIILKVDGQDVSGLPLEQVVGRILGPAGTKVTLTLLNPHTKATRDVTLVRAAITMHNVTWNRLPGTSMAHLRIAGFSEGVTGDLKNAVRSLRREKLDSIILDLRDNPGGLLDEGIATASQFLGGGNVLLEKDAEGNIKPVPVEPGGVATDIPTVVLVNGGTASAAEIVAGALKDANRSTLVGEKTFGTGTVLSEFSLSDGSALLLAVEEWLTPSGHTIWHQGISPDVTVALPPDTTPLFPRAERGMTAAQLRASPDKQLLRAMAVLQGARR